MTLPGRLVIIGIGLIGGSLAAALRRLAAPPHITAIDSDPEALRVALAMGLVDAVANDYTAVADADVCVIATPLRAYASVMTQLAQHCRQTCVITDTGSGKQCVLTTAEQIWGTIPPVLVPAHPLAGTERSGPAAAIATLFDKQWLLLTPTDHTDAAALTTVEALWRAAGARPYRLSADDHDYLMARTSHLPHMLAYALVNQLLRSRFGADVFSFTAGGFRDLSRIASSQPAMWRDIAIGNRHELLLAIEECRTMLAIVADALRAEDGEALEAFFATAKQARDDAIQ